MNCPYNSRDLSYKSIFGAVHSGKSVRFRIKIPRSFSCSGAYLIVRKDGTLTQKIDLIWSGLSESEKSEWWRIDYLFPSQGIYFYHFEYQTPFGAGKIFLKSSGMGEFSPSGNEWQQTVYDASFKTPDWILGGIMYQIFPDRFFSFGSKKENVPTDRVIHKSFDEPVVFRPDDKGEILNNDYYGGDLDGICEKLSYLKSLSVTAIYLNPIFEAHSNHRYNTADYMKIDPMLGDTAALKRLCKKAAEYGIRIILDGVFSHTGSDSIYFNKEKRYGKGGAYNDKESPFYNWYTFTENGKYKCWWGIKTLPEVDENNPSYLSFITGENGVLQKWQSTGISGWRLDVADELPDLFLDELYKRVKKEDKDCLIIGEVWEDASNKMSYGKRRRYLLGGQLDSVMNYPLKDAMLSFMRYGVAEELMESIVTICENYPKETLNSLMNHIGTHDTVRVLTYLVSDGVEYKPRELLSKLFLTQDEYEHGKKLLKTLSVLQYMLPGFPSLYYGDEAGLTGGSDPFNRAFYPWDKQDSELLSHYRLLGELRQSLSCLKEGKFIPISAMLGCIAFARECEKCDEGIIVIINKNPHNIDYYLPDRYKNSVELLTNSPCGDFVNVPKIGAAIVKANYLI